MSDETTPGIGDNSLPAAREALRGLMSQIVACERETEGIKTDIKAYYESAKEQGFDTRALRAAVKRKMETPTKREDRERHEEVVEMYLTLAAEGGSPAD